MNPLVSLIVRHGVSAVGAGLVAKGVLSADAVTSAATAVETIFGSGAVLLGLFMSYRDKKKNGIV